MSTAIYTSWNLVPKHLATKTQLAKDGLKLAEGQQPVAVKSGGYRPYDLYDRNTAVPKRASSPAQREAAQRNIQKAQAALYCVDCSTYGERLTDGRCRHCRLLWRAQEQATTWFANLAGRDDWLLIDTETTRLDDAAEIVQIGIVSHDGRVLMDQLVRPLGDISPEATAVHGLDAAALSDCPSWPEIYPEVTRLIEGKLLLAYNADFDSRTLRQTCQQYGHPSPPNEWQCIMENFAQWYGQWSDYWHDFKWQPLGTAVEVRGVASDGGHNAAHDAVAAWRVVESFWIIEVVDG